MKKETISRAIADLKPAYVEEAAAESVVGSKIRPDLRKWGTAAACLAVAVFAATALLSGADTPVSPLPGHTDSLPQQPAEVRIQLSDIPFNEMAEQTGAIKLWFDPQLYDEAAWDGAAVAAYFGKDLTPPYIPEGLIPEKGNGTATAFIRKDDTIAYDTVSFGFYHDYYADGSPKLTEGVSAVKGFSMVASRIGLVNDAIYVLPGDEQSFDMGGVPVMFGHRSMPYGPYDPNTHAPAGFYDVYVATFEDEEIRYQVVTHQLEREELVKIVSSILYGKEAVIEA